MNKLEFGLNEDGLSQLAILIASLNASGVRWTIRKDAHAIEITISTNY